MKAIIILFVISLIYNYILGRILVKSKPSTYVITEENATKIMTIDAIACLLATLFVSIIIPNSYSHHELTAFLLGSFIGITIGQFQK
ncbi:MAG: hypothetical protein UT05_C0006G0047 [Parcubacteria group bacterium GW2011_GWF2_38_76]|nr:MAG: hypothetical protein UT05_C0006G0047 [Parcubacteria group bacterium GW2011_GWF2_38_76]